MMSTPLHTVVMLTLDDVLELPTVRRARPRVVAEALPSSTPRTVRWVHTSEIFEIGPLLRGGELLLTTGLGLVGASPEQLRHYVDSLIDGGAVGLCLELGRPFESAPAALVARARERGLAVIEFGAVVPFVAITEAVHELLLSEELRSARLVDGLADRLLRLLQDGASLEELVVGIEESLSCPVRVRETSGSLVAAGPLGRSLGSRDGVTWSVVDVLVGAQVWGGLEVADASTTVIPALTRAAQILAVSRWRPDAASTVRASARRALAHELTDPNAAASPDNSGLLRAAADLGLRFDGADPVRLLGLSVVGVRVGQIGPRIEAAVRRIFDATIALDVDGQVVLLLSGRAVGRPPAAIQRALAAAVDVISASGGQVRAAVLGEPLPGVDSAVGAMADIRDGLRMAPAWTVGLRSPTSSTADGVAPPALRVRELALGRLLLARSATADVDDFVERTLGPVLQHDARRRGALLPTLEAYLDAAGNKRSAAAALGIQRQTLYARLARLDELLGADLSEPRTRTSLHVAVLAWRLRTGAAGFRALPDARVASREG